MPDILVSESLDGPGLEELRQRHSVSVQPELWRDPGALAARLAESRALIVRNQTQVTSELIRASNRLEVIGRAGAGLDNIDVSAAREAGITVCYAPDQNALSVAELAMAMLLALARRLVSADRSTHAGEWARGAFGGMELSGKTLGVVGFGRIGFLLAMRARAFGMRVLAHDPFVGADAVTVTESGAELTTLDDLLARADVVSCHVPSTPASHKLFGAERFRAMKQTALFLNLARGDVVDEPALIEALRQGWIGGAGLDVRAIEPPAPSPLDEMENVILTPHIGAFTAEAQARVVAVVCRDIAAVLDGRPALYACAP
ncbi:MAG: hydroxyacid dehydrogenase [Vicinamibacteraceae bacterium]